MLVRLEVRRGGYVGRFVVGLQCALEWARGSRCTDAADLLVRCCSFVVSHQSIILILVLVPAPDSPGNDQQATQDGSTTDSNNYTNDSVFRLG